MDDETCIKNSQIRDHFMRWKSKFPQENKIKFFVLRISPVLIYIFFFFFQGVNIHGFIHHAFPESYETIMDEGEWFAIRNFKLQHSLGLLRITKNRFTVLLTKKTIIFKNEPQTYSNYYAFKTFGSVLRGLCHPMYCIGMSR